MYPSGMPLGPHYVETPPPEQGRLSKFVGETLGKTKQLIKQPHHVSSALILIAILSFSANIGFLYLDFVGQGINPEISVIQAGRGSDDGNEIEQPPTFTLSTHFKVIPNPAPLKITALGYVVADAETGEIIIEKNADTAYPIASVSKLMTAIVAREHIDSRHNATVSRESVNAYGTEGELFAGEKIAVSDLYYPLLIESSNDSAEVLADDFGREDFMKLMNEKASVLTMDQTTFEDPSGLSPRNASTAHDLTKLGLYIYTSYPELLDITRVRQYAILSHTWINKNMFLTYPNFIGGKNGFIDEAKKTTVSFFKVFFRGQEANSKAVDRPILIVLLKSNDRDRDASLLLSYISKNIRYEEQKDTE